MRRQNGSDIGDFFQAFRGPVDVRRLRVVAVARVAGQHDAIDDGRGGWIGSDLSDGPPEGEPHR